MNTQNTHLFSRLFAKAKESINLFRIKNASEYLYTDENGNEIYLYPTTSSEFTRRVSVAASKKYCVVEYFADERMFYREKVKLDCSIIL